MSSSGDIGNLEFREIESWLAQHKIPLYRARQISEWLWKKGTRDFDQMTNLPAALKAELHKHFFISRIEKIQQVTGKDKTTKIVFQTDGNYKIESVLIYSAGRTTACISTQAGCPLACKFCATGLGGFKRNLSVTEIFDQVIALNKLSAETFGSKLSNIVYMGMGEPLLNLRNTMLSIKNLTNGEYGQAISPQRITISTAGIPQGIISLANAGINCHLAISLHTAEQEKRELIMPIAKKYPLDELTEAIKYFHRKTKKRIFIEYLLLKDFNDTQQDAEKLAFFCRNFPVKINLIEYNEVQGSRFSKSEKNTTESFIKFLESKNLLVNMRKSRGEDIKAACGQLANNN